MPAALGYFLLRILDPFLVSGLWAVLLAFKANERQVRDNQERGNDFVVPGSR